MGLDVLLLLGRVLLSVFFVAITVEPKRKCPPAQHAIEPALF